MAVTGNYANRAVSLLRGGLEGSGTVGPVTGTRGYIAPLAPGNPTKAASLTVKGHLSMSRDVSYRVIVNGSAAGQHGQTTVTGNLTVAGARLVFDSSTRTADITLNQFITLITSSGPAAVSGTFDSVPDGAIVPDPLDPSLCYRVGYGGGTSGHDVIAKTMHMRGLQQEVPGPPGGCWHPFVLTDPIAAGLMVRGDGSQVAARGRSPR